MSNAKHTPGPWFTEDCRDISDGIWIESEHKEVGLVSHAEVRWGCTEAEELGNLEANARLIAASPDLLSALERLESSYALLLAGKPVRDVEETLAEVRAAIAKAKGE